MEGSALWRASVARHSVAANKRVMDRSPYVSGVPVRLLQTERRTRPHSRPNYPNREYSSRGQWIGHQHLKTPYPLVGRCHIPVDDLKSTRYTTQSLPGLAGYCDGIMHEPFISTHRLERRFDLRPTNFGLEISIRDDQLPTFLATIQEHDKKVLKCERTDRNLGTFRAPGSSGWGIDSCFGNIRPTRDGFRGFEFQLPRIYGSGCQGLITGDRLLSCLELVLTALPAQDRPPVTDGGQPGQLIDNIRLHRPAGKEGLGAHYQLAAWLGVEVVDWLSTQRDGPLPNHETDQTAICQRVWQQAPPSDYQVVIEGGSLLLTTPNGGGATAHRTGQVVAEGLKCPAQVLLTLHSLARTLDHATRA